MNAWTDSRYEMVRHFSGWVYVAVDRVATAVAMHQPNVSVCSSDAEPLDEAQKSLSDWRRHKALLPLRTHEHLRPVRGDHPLARLLEDPNEPDTSFDLWYETTMYLLLTGNSYWWLPPNHLGYPSAVWVLPAHWVYAHAGDDGAIDAYELRPVEGNYMRVSIPSRDVIHFRKKSPVSKIDGYSPQTAGSRWIDTQESIDRSRWFSFRNGVFPGVSVEFDAGMKLPDERDLDRIEARLMQRYGTEVNSNRPMLVPPGAKVKQLHLSPRELMYCESTEQLRDQILSLFGVPAVIAQVQTGASAGDNLAAQSAFYQLTLNPLYRMYGQALTTNLAAPRYDRRLRVWWEDRTPQDPDLLEKQLKTDLAYGARTMNEVRGLRGLEPYKQAWGNVPWIPLNTLPIEQALRIEPSSRPGSSGGNLGTQQDPDAVGDGSSDGHGGSKD